MKKFLALTLAVLMLLTTACTTTPVDPADTSDTSTETGTPDGTTSETVGETTSQTDIAGRKQYNIIFALATVPPVLASLDAIASGHETYAIIERGKTYNGIESLEYFHNAGFDPANNLSLGFTATEFEAMTTKVKELKEADPTAYFHFYVQDGTALTGAGIAANASLTLDDFRVIMIEDGTGAYNALQNTYIKGQTITAEADGAYDNFVAKAADAKAEFEAIMAKTDNAISDTPFKYSIGKAYALATLPNFIYWIQDRAMLEDILTSAGGEGVNTKLCDVFGVEGFEGEVACHVNLKYQKIAEGVSQLSETQRTDYLTLMYGQYYADTYNGLTRTERAGEKAPEKKLVFIGARHAGYPNLASDAKYGVGGLDRATATIPASYAELDAKYKTELLFATEADYNTFLAEINDTANYSADVDPELKRLAQIDCFNYYIDYIYTLKLVYALYGSEYDIIMKGHPREAIGGHAEWGSMYRVDMGEGDDLVKYYYDKLMDNALLAFHESDSTGKYFGMVPYGTSAENLAYLGVEIAIAGLPSSTYNGYDTDVDVVFVLAETNEDITGSGSETPASQVKARYEAGNLTYVDKNGETKICNFYNIGNIYKALASVYTAKGNTAAAETFNQAFKAWLAQNLQGAADIDEQGFAVKAE